MKRSSVLWGLFMLMTVTVLPSSAQEEDYNIALCSNANYPKSNCRSTEDFLWYTVDGDGYITLRYCNNDKAHRYGIRSDFHLIWRMGNEGYVKRIAEGCFQNLGTVQQLFIPEHITHVGARAFSNMPDLKSIEIEPMPDGKGMPYLPAVIWFGDEVFMGNGRLSSITFPDQIQMGEGLFKNCGSLSYVDFSSTTSGFETLKAGTFMGCSSLIGVKLPENCTTIGAHCFSETGITNLDFLDSNIPDGYIGAYAFSNCANLKFLNMGAFHNIKTISPYTFQHCKFLEKFVLPPNVEVLDTGAFSHCESLTSIDLFPNKAGQPPLIHTECFAHCYNLDTANVIISHLPILVGNNWFAYTYDKNRDYDFPHVFFRIKNGEGGGFYDFYGEHQGMEKNIILSHIFSDANWSKVFRPLTPFSYRFTENMYAEVTEITDMQRTTLYLPDVIFDLDIDTLHRFNTKLWQYPLRGFGGEKLNSSLKQSAITKLHLKYITSLSDGTFNNFGNKVMDEINGEYLTDIGRNCFVNLTVDSLVLGHEVEHIGAGSFQNCVAPFFRDLAFYGLKRFPAGVFYGCSTPDGALRLTLPNVSYLEDYQFKGFKTLDVSFGDALRFVGKQAFAESAIKSIRLPQRVLKTTRKSDGMKSCTDAFYNCKQLKDLDFY
ncbi:MAG: leucine-rich repeat domain-containing protein [Proteiniphilum sp.]|jgi:hypothetical protein|nr:leucine-rich repeat domain-containing protein [Proteiniphilum sp.]